VLSVLSPDRLMSGSGSQSRGGPPLRASVERWNAWSAAPVCETENTQIASTFSRMRQRPQTAAGLKYLLYAIILFTALGIIIGWATRG